MRLSVKTLLLVTATWFFAVGLSAADTTKRFDEGVVFAPGNAQDTSPVLVVTENPGRAVMLLAMLRNALAKAGVVAIVPNLPSDGQKFDYAAGMKNVRCLYAEAAALAGRKLGDKYVFGFSSGSYLCLKIGLENFKSFRGMILAAPVMPDVNLPDLGKVDLPLLVVAGEKDELAPPAKVAALRQALIKSGVKRVEQMNFQGAGHVEVITQNADRIVSWITDLDAGGEKPPDARDAYRPQTLSAGAAEIVKNFAAGKGNYKILYFGNSRVQPPGGFGAFGCQTHFADKNILRGTGFIRLFANSSGCRLDGVAITAEGKNIGEKDFDLAINTWNYYGQVLEKGKKITLVNIRNGGAIKADRELVFTLNYRKSPEGGRLKITPLACADTVSVSPLADGAVVVDTRADEPCHAFTRVKIPALSDPGKSRGVEIETIEGVCCVYDAHVWCAADDGYAVGAIGIGGKGYHLQIQTEKGAASACLRSDYLSLLRSYDPDIVFMQYADNQNSERFGEGLRELIARIREVREGRPTLFLFQADNVSPRANSLQVIERSWKKMIEVCNAETDCIILDPNPHLPQDWPPAGREELGAYFHNAVHENAKGYRTVFDALYADLKLKVETK